MPQNEDHFAIFNLLSQNICCRFFFSLAAAMLLLFINYPYFSFSVRNGKPYPRHLQ
jgi:hypothetical protein